MKNMRLLQPICHSQTVYSQFTKPWGEISQYPYLPIKQTFAQYTHTHTLHRALYIEIGELLQLLTLTTNWTIVSLLRTNRLLTWRLDTPWVVGQDRHFEPNATSMELPDRSSRRLRMVFNQIDTQCPSWPSISVTKLGFWVAGCWYFQHPLSLRNWLLTIGMETDLAESPTFSL